MRSILKIKLVAAFTFFALVINAQTVEESVQKTFQQFDTAKTIGQMMAASSQFDLLAAKYPTEYITNYYSFHIIKFMNHSQFHHN